MKTPWIILIPDTADSWSGTLFSDRSERRNLEDADALQKIDEKLLPLCRRTKKYCKCLKCIRIRKAGNVSNYIERNA